MKFNNHSPRFSSFSIGLDMDVKLRGLRSGFWRCFGLSVGFLIGLVLLDPFRPTAEQAPRPPAIKLVQTPVVAEQVPVLEQEPSSQSMASEPPPSPVSVGSHSANTRTQGVEQSELPVAGSLSFLPRVPPSAIRTGTGLAPSLSAIEDPTDLTDRYETPVDFSLEMPDVHSIEPRRHQPSVAAQQEIKSVVKLASVCSSNDLGWEPAGFANNRTVDALADALNEYTSLRVEVGDQLTFGDDRLLELSLIAKPIYRNLTEEELQNVVRYLMEGGFLLGGVRQEVIFRGLEHHGGLVQGEDFWSEVLPDDHPVYRAFFKLEGGLRSRTLLSMNPSGGPPNVTTVNGLVGYFIQGRMFGIDPIESRAWRRGNDFELMLATNIVVYALTQEGSIAQLTTR